MDIQRFSGGSGFARSVFITGRTRNMQGVAACGKTDTGNSRDGALMAALTAYPPSQLLAATILIAILCLVFIPSRAVQGRCLSGPQWSGGHCESRGNDIMRPKAKTPRQNKLLFMMVSAWHLLPYDNAYLDNALEDLARTRISGIIYAGAGELTQVLRRKGVAIDEAAYNERIYKKAVRHGAKLWLQLRVYANSIAVPGEDRRKTLTAREILKSKRARRAFLKEVTKEIFAYNRYFAKSCRIILFEEAGIYHSPGGGGRFWSSSNRRAGKRTPEFDRIFASRMARMTRLLKNAVFRVNPRCKVGIHLGHSAFLNRPVLTRWMRWLERKKARPDFIFYDFYLKSQKNFENYARKLRDRVRYIHTRLRLPVLHLAQLHTMNAFQHGGGRTPSKRELDAIIALDRELGVEGTGFYTKNALPTRNMEKEPFAPNLEGQKTVFESSRDRWDYGLLLLSQLRGLDYRKRFSLVLQGVFEPDEYHIHLRNQRTGAWDFAGILDTRGRRDGRRPATIIFRFLKTRDYLAKGWIGILVCRRSAGAGGSLLMALAIPTRPPEQFLTGVRIQQMLKQKEHIPSGWRLLSRPIPLVAGEKQLRLRLYPGRK